MTIEELDIIVEASIEPALKEIKRLMPQIRQQISQIGEMTQKSMQKMDMKSIQNKMQKAIQFIKNKIDNLKKSGKNNEIAIKVNNKEASKQISQLEKEIDSLQKKINARQMKLDIITPQMDKILSDTRNKVVPEGVVKNDKSMDKVVDNALSSNKDFTTLNSQAQKLYTEIEMYNNELNEAKSKMSALKQEINQTVGSQNKLTTFFSAFKNKIDQTKGSIGNVKKTFNQIPKITQNINNNIKDLSKGLKNGLGHILKYATALFSLRGIYSVLSQSAQSWLSSQNIGAQQLSANIEYMKYAMGSVLAPIIQFVTNLVYQLMKAIQSVAYALTGVNIFAKATASSMNNVAGSAKKAKKEVQALAGVHDEINNIQTKNNSDSGGGSGAITPSFDLSEMKNTPNSIIEAIQNGNWSEIGSLIGEKINDALASIPWNKIQNTSRSIATNIAQTLNGFIETTDWNLVGKTFAEGINTAINFVQGFVQNTEWEQLGQSIGSTIASTIKNIKWEDFFQTLVDMGTGLLNVLNGIFTNNTDYSGAQDAFVNGLFNIDTSKFFQALLGLAGKLMAVAIKWLTGISLFEIIWQYLIEPALKNMEESGEQTIGGFFKGIGNALAGIGQWIHENIFLPFINGFKEAFGIHSPSTVMEEQGNFIIDGLKNGLTGIWDKVKSIFETFGSNVAEKFSNIKDNISNTWDNVKTTAQDKWNSIKESIGNKWENIKTIATEKFGNIKDKVSEAWTNITKDKEMSNMMTIIKDKFSNLGQNASTWGKDLVTNMSNGIKNNISKVTSAVNSVASKIKGLLGFSEPEEGPLSNFHTYMPDMIDLMVSGIKSNMSRVTDELENMTAQMSYTINTPDISPLSINESGINSNMIQPRNIMEETLSDLLSYNNGNSNISIPLSVYVGNKKLGEILLDNLRDKKRQTGKNIEALVGG